MIQDVWRNFGFFCGCLRSFSISESLTLSDKGYCVSTGNEFENWVYYPEKISDASSSHNGLFQAVNYPEKVSDVETVKKAMKFFADRCETFMWPVYDGGFDVLEEAGLVHAGHLEAMSLEPSRAVTKRVNPSVKFKAVTNYSLSDEWAKCEWSAFEYGGSTESAAYKAYIALARAFCDDERMLMYIAELDGIDAGAFLVTNEADMIGVYYFAAVPELRRKGIASSMMSEICGLSKGRKIVLQATPSGVPFYESFGFDDLGAMEVYSTTADIF